MDLKIKKGDTVEIISGKLEEKGKRGEVIKVLPSDESVVVSGINLHTKASASGSNPGPDCSARHGEIRNTHSHIQRDDCMPKMFKSNTSRH